MRRSCYCSSTSYSDRAVTPHGPPDPRRRPCTCVGALRTKPRQRAVFSRRRRRSTGAKSVATFMPVIDGAALTISNPAAAASEERLTAQHTARCAVYCAFICFRRRVRDVSRKVGYASESARRSGLKAVPVLVSRYNAPCSTSSVSCTAGRFAESTWTLPRAQRLRSGRRCGSFLKTVKTGRRRVQAR